MRRILCVNFGIVAVTAGLAGGQQPAAQPQPPIRTIIAKPNPATQQQPQVRTGIGASDSGTQPQSPTAARRAVRVQPRPIPAAQQRVTPPRPAVVPQAQPAPTPVPTPAPTPAPTPVSLQPMTPSEMPPVPPQVTYRDGLLTVQALNSTLGSLLQAIRNKTGIQFEGAENSGERVAVSAGPAPEGEVLASIFNGSGYDYVVIGRADDPAIVQRVLLTPKARGGAAPGAFAQQPPTPQAAQQELPEEEAPDEQVEPDQPQDIPAQPPQVTPPPTAQEQPQQPKTPEQLLEELKQMQQKQQGQQPQPNQVPIKPPPR